MSVSGSFRIMSCETQYPSQRQYITRRFVLFVVEGLEIFVEPIVIRDSREKSVTVVLTWKIL